ncbi:hypothetical protein D3C87_1747160 [compost metagenome]
MHHRRVDLAVALGRVHVEDDRAHHPALDEVDQPVAVGIQERSLAVLIAVDHVEGVRPLVNIVVQREDRLAIVGSRPAHLDFTAVF